jgi:choloylglycine hydrolase
MEFSVPMHSKIVFYTRGQRYTSECPPHCKPLTWVSKYGFIGIQVFDMTSPVDGINEAGLSCGILTLDATEYPLIKKGDLVVAITDVCHYLLATCQTTTQAVSNLNKITIWGNPVSFLDKIIGLHLSIHDRYGSNVVVEILSGKLHIYDNPHGVLTNGPPLPEQFELLKTYKQGLLTIPDDSSSITRFIKLSCLKDVVIIPNTVLGIVQLFCHLFNTVDIIEGTTPSTQYGPNNFEITQWMIIKDLVTGDIWYRSYNDFTLRSIKMNQIDFTREYDHILICANKPYIIDMTPN